MVREMIGGCCVCLDERGWNENPLVYCDGSGCTIAVHQGLEFFIRLMIFFLNLIVKQYPALPLIGKYWPIL